MDKVDLVAMPYNNIFVSGTGHFMSFGTTPVTINCHNCGKNITTSVIKKTGAMQWLACGICCIFGCDFGCCFIPFCIDSLKDVTHSCPNCNIVLGKSKGGF